jgi:hypothetical protein
MLNGPAFCQSAPAWSAAPRLSGVLPFIIEGNVIELIDIAGLSREERSDLLERLWDSLTANQEDYPL